jgi:hypothetical protein
MKRDSDLVALPAVAGTILVLLAIFVCFFFIGPVVGIIVLVAAIVLGIALFARVLSKNEVR